MKVALITLAALAITVRGAPAPKADPEAFIDLGAVALPALFGSPLIDGLLLGKVAFLKAAILANLLLGSTAADEPQSCNSRDGCCNSRDGSDAYGAPCPVQEYGAPPPEYGVPAYEPVVDSYGAPAPSYDVPAPTYDEPAPSYDAPAPTYEEPAPSYDAPPPSYEEPDTYGAPAANPLPSYGAPEAPAYSAPNYYRF